MTPLDWAHEPAPDGAPAATDLDLLADPPSTVSARDLDAALSGPPPSARALRLTRMLTLGLVLALGFACGVLADQSWGQSGSATAPPTGDRRAAGPTGMPTGMPGGDGPAGSGTSTPTGGTGDTTTTTTGTVTLVDGSVLYLTDPTGTLVRVEVSDRTEVSQASPISTSDIDEGDTVTATGTSEDDTLAATSVEVTR